MMLIHYTVHAVFLINDGSRFLTLTAHSPMPCLGVNDSRRV